MPLRCCAALAALFLTAAAATASMDPPAKVLRAYGPGGPHHALQEAAELYKERHGVTVGVFKAGHGELSDSLREKGDIFFTGAEFMLEDFVSANPGVVDLHTLEKLYPRRIGILVRKGNPLNIEGLDCLQEEDIDLLAVHLEEMETFYESPYDEPLIVSKRVSTGQEGVKAWRSLEHLDAWVTYKTWHVQLEDESEFVEIDHCQSLRHTILALTHRTPHRQEALNFIKFLKSPDARRIFQKHGWE